MLCAFTIVFTLAGAGLCDCVNLATFIRRTVLILSFLPKYFAAYFSAVPNISLAAVVSSFLSLIVPRLIQATQNTLNSLRNSSFYPKSACLP